MPGVHGAFWFIAKVLVYLYGFLWIRFTFPRYRFDQLMQLGWQFLIPLALVNVVGTGIALALQRELGWRLSPSLLLTNRGHAGGRAGSPSVAIRVGRQSTTTSALDGDEVATGMLDSNPLLLFCARWQLSPRF